jgi:hypothetical protein
MSRFAHHHPEDPQGALDRLVDRADHAKKEARENAAAPVSAARDDMLVDILGTVRAATRALHPETAIPPAFQGREGIPRDDLSAYLPDDKPAPPAAQAEHEPIVDGRTAAFSGDRQARAALSAWLLDGADILRRCRVEGHDQGYCRDTLAEFAMTALLHFDRYQGRVRDPLERDTLRQWVERELAGEGEAR